MAKKKHEVWTTFQFKTVSNPIKLGNTEVEGHISGFVSTTDGAFALAAHIRDEQDE